MTGSQAHITVWVALLLAACAAPGLLAQPTTPIPSAPPSSGHAEHLDSRDGLSHNTVFSTYQDRLGYLWIATDDGLNRYDGYTFKVYRHDPNDPASLLQNTVHSLNEDPAGNIWITTPRAFSRFDRRTEQFVHYVTTGDAFASQPPHLSPHTGPHFWLINGDGLFCYDPKAEALQRIALPPEQDAFWNAFVDDQETVWIGTAKGYLHKYVPATGKWERFKAPWNIVNIIHFADDQGRLWIENPQGTGTFDPATEAFSFVELPAVSSSTLYPRLKDRNGFIWFYSALGPLRYDPVTGNALPFTLDPPPLGPNMGHTYEDRAGSIWLATLSGLYRLDPAAKPFRHYAHDARASHSLSNNIVMAIRESDSGALWVGTLGGGLNRLDPTTGQSTPYRHQPKRPGSLCHDRIWSLYEDTRGALWVGTDQGLCALDPQTGQFQAYKLPPSPTWRRSVQPPVNAIREDVQGRLWLATNDGLHRLDPTRGPDKHFPIVIKKGNEGAYGTGEGPYVAFIQSLHLDRTGLLWVGTSDGELFRLDPDTEALTAYPGLQDVMPVANEGLLAIQADHRGILWLGSKRGLTRFDPETDTAQHYGLENGLPASIVYAILEDDRHQLWISTNGGLVRFTDRYPDAQFFRTYDIGDGLGNAEFNRRAAFKNDRGELFFGGMNGLTAFFPDQIHDNPYRPPVVLTQIQRSNRDTTVSVIPDDLDHLVLSYRDYTVSFEFAALNFTNPAQNQYAYQLEGFDDGWIESGTRRQVQYTSIPPGRYTFRVKATNDDGVWNEDGVALHLTVTPPFWQTWWFRTLASLLVLGSLVAGVRYVSTRTLRQQIRELETQQRLQHERARISRDLHDHVGAQVSNIISGIELINLNARAGTPDDFRPHLAALDEDARRTMAQLRETIWALHHDAVTLDELGEQLRRYIHSRQRYRDRPAVHCTVTGDGSLTLSPVQALNLFRIAQEALNNACKHADADNVYIAVRTPEAGTVELVIRDDGAFREPASGNGLNGYGLQSMERRAQELGGTFSLRTDDGAGTTVLVTMPVG